MNGFREEHTSFRALPSAFEGLARYRRFGEVGPVYEVLWSGDDMVRVRLVETGEEVDYRLDRALADPCAD